MAIEGECIKKMCIYTQWEYYAALKTEEILPFMTPQVNPEDVMLTEISQTQRDKYCVIPLI